MTLKQVFTGLALLLCGFAAQGQTYTFKCLTDSDTKDINPDSCEGCAVWLIDSRSFDGLLIYKDSIPFRWIEIPYTLKARSDTVDIWEHTSPPSYMGRNKFFPDRVSITLGQTNFATMQDFLDSTFCNALKLTGGGGFNVDSLNYYTCDSTAMIDGLAEGDPYLLDCNNCYGLPAGLFKVVKICGFDCNFQMRYFPNDSTAVANGIPPGREYVLDEDNILGILYGFIKAAYPDSIPSGTLECNADLPEFDNDLDAIIAGRMFGDLYTMTATNTYGAPEGMERAVSSISSTVADPPNCCDADGRLPFYDNDADAIAGGLSSGFYYYLSASNTLGYPYGTKKRIT